MIEDLQVGRSYYFYYKKLAEVYGEGFYFKIIAITNSTAPGTNRLVEYRMFGEARNHKSVYRHMVNCRELNPVKRILYGT